MREKGSLQVTRSSSTEEKFPSSDEVRGAWELIEQATGYQNMYDSICLPLRSTKKKASDVKKDTFLMHAFLRVLTPYFDSADLDKHGRKTRPDRKMIARLCSTNPESFKRF